MKIKFAVILVLLAAIGGSTFGQGVIISPKTVLGTVNGVTRPISTATVTVCAANIGGTPCSPALANTLFKDAALTQPLSNPFTADANGNYQFALAAGTYTVTETGAGFTGYSYQLQITCSSGAACTVSNLTATGSLSVTGASALNGGLTTTTATASGLITANAGITSAGPNALNGSTISTGGITCKAVNNVVCVDTANTASWSGADAGAWISSACNSLPATGGTVDARGLQGSFTFSSDWMSTITKPCAIVLGNVALSGAANQGLTLSQSNVTITGVNNGSSGSVIKANGTIVGNNFIHVTGANVAFRNFRVDTTGHTCAANINAIFADTTATSFLMDTMYVLGNGTSDVFNCGAVNLQGNTYIVKNSTFDSISGDSLAVGVSVVDGQILNNFLLNYRLGIYLQNQANNTIVQGNILQSVAGSGIVAGIDGILVQGANNITLIGNVIKAAREHGIYIASGGAGQTANQQVTVSSNVFGGIPGVAIKVHSSFAPNFPERQMTITGNNIQCGSTSVGAGAQSVGWQIDGVSGVAITGNTERFCQTGLDIEGAYGVQISGNTIEYNNAAGIFMRDATGVLKDISVTGNHVNNNNVTLGGFPAVELLPDNGGAGGGTNVDTNIVVSGNSINDYQATFPAQTTTAANVTGNIATLTMTNTPLGTGFFVNAQGVVSGFTGADTIFNGTFTLTGVTATTITYALVHANQTASTNGSVTMAATQNNGISYLAPANGSAVNNVRDLDNTCIGILGNCRTMAAGYTNSYSRYTANGSPNSPSFTINGWIGSTYNRVDGPPWVYTKPTGDGTQTGWIALAPTNRLMASSSGAVTTTTQGQPGGMTAFTWNVDAAGLYNFDCELFYQISSVTGVPSPAMSVGGTATYTSLWAAADGYQTAALTTAGSVVTAAASASTLVTTASTPVTTNLPFRFRGAFTVNAAGTFLVQAANSLNAGASITIGSGGACSLSQVQ